LSIAIVPGAVTTSFLGPDVNHLADVVAGVSYGRSYSKGETHVDGFTVVVVEIVVYPQEEELVLVPSIEGQISDPEHPLTCCDRKSTSH